MARFAQKHTSDFETGSDKYQHGYHFPTENYAHITKPGLSPQVVEEISHIKGEPEWMLKLRLQALKQFEAKSMPVWGADLSAINFDKIHYYLRPTDRQEKSWEDVPPEVKTTFERLGIPEAEREVLAGVKAQYDCLTADSRVFTDKGIKRIVDITTNDVVFSLNESTGLLEKQRVLGLASKGGRVVYEVRTQGGRTIEVTKNHPFYSLQKYVKPDSVRGRYKKEWKYLSDLNVGDLIGLATEIPDSGESFKVPEIKIPLSEVKSRNQFKEYTLNIEKRYAKLRFPSETNEDLMWLLGFYLGDGFLGGKISTESVSRYTRVCLAVAESDQQLRDEIKKISKELFDYNPLVSSEDCLVLNSVLFVQMIEKLGFIGSAATKKIPDWVFSLPRSQKLAFIGGYFDADGNVRSGSNNALVFTSISKEILNSLKLLAISCGLNPSHIWDFQSNYTYKGTTKINNGYRVQVSGQISMVGSRCLRKRQNFQERKYVHKFKTAKGTVFRSHTSDHLGFTKILSIKEIGEKPVYDIEVEGHHNFVANGLIVHNSEVVYGSLKEVFAKDGVIFLSMDDGLRQYPDLVKEYFGKVIPSGDNKFSALNTATWSGGSFVYVPPGVHVKMPLQTYFRINSENAGQFERTLIIVDEGAKVHYVEGCTAPSFSSNSLHSAVVEIFVKKGGRCQYTTVQNWYKNIYNLVTKRAWVEEEGEMIWTDFNMGSKVTMKYPSFILAGKGARGETLSMALAGAGQHQDTGSKAIHLAPHTSSTIVSKSISKDGGRTSYRGMVNVGPKATQSKNTVICDALLLDSLSRTDTYPTDKIFNSLVEVQHEATVSKIGDDQLFYLMSRGITEENARKMIVNGFVDDLVRKLPLEFAVEMNRLIDHEMEGSIG